MLKSAAKHTHTHTKKQKTSVLSETVMLQCSIPSSDDFQNPSKSCSLEKPEFEFCNSLPKFLIPNLRYNLLMNLHNQQTWSPDHCFEPHLPSHLALYKKMEIPLQTFTRRTNNNYCHLGSFSFDTSPTPGFPVNFQAAAYIPLKTLPFGTPSPWKFQ